MGTRAFWQLLLLVFNPRRSLTESLPMSTSALGALSVTFRATRTLHVCIMSCEQHPRIRAFDSCNREGLDFARVPQTFNFSIASGIVCVFRLPLATTSHPRLRRWNNETGVHLIIMLSFFLVKHHLANK